MSKTLFLKKPLLLPCFLFSLTILSNEVVYGMKKNSDFGEIKENFHSIKENFKKTPERYCLKRAEKYRNMGKFSEAILIFDELAKQGNSEAMRHLGEMCDWEEGFKSDENKAIDYYQQAIEKGNDRAMVSLAYKYIEHGNEEDGKKLLEKAVQCENIDAIIYLAEMYLDANIPERSKAIELLKLGANLRYKQAKRYLEDLGETVSMEEVESEFSRTDSDLDESSENENSSENRSHSLNESTFRNLGKKFYHNK